MSEARGREQGAKSKEKSLEQRAKSEEREVTVGDVAHILQGENHWHGAKKESYMSHITITAVDR